MNERGERHPLTVHLRETAARAAEFASAFGAEDLARAAGLLHDAGKADPRFQEYLSRCERGDRAATSGPQHKAAGAVIALERGMEVVVPLVQGHHGGLRAVRDARAWAREQRTSPDVRMTLAGLPAEIRDLVAFEAPAPPKLDECAADLFLRMTFSALVDADFLDTEAHFTPSRPAARRSRGAGLAQLHARLARRLDAVESGASERQVDAVRKEVRRLCEAASEAPPGLFRLVVPTGGGKTRSAMAFALAHAVRHGLRRVIVAVPFLSITEQTADVYRGDLGPGSVLEHHSGMDREEQAGEGPPGMRLWSRLSAENWDAPVVVTTTVQLFESLFSNRTSATRKLHRIARSVIVLDEAQALPPDLFRPIVEMLRQLCDLCGCTVVLSTATQPASAMPALDWLSRARDIVPQPERFFALLRRVEWVTAPGTWSPARVAEEMRGQAHALAILNTRRDALTQLDHCGPGALHLSTLLCGAHRRTVLAEVRRRLDRSEPCHLVATQVVEAGVNLDFPLVLRAVGPFDAIVQAGGRCNREGRLARGRVVVFRGEGQQAPRGWYLTGTGIAGTMLAEGLRDFDDPAQAETYFRRLYGTIDVDSRQVLQAQRDLDFPEVARRFRMIDDDTTPVLVPYGARAAALASAVASPRLDAAGAGRSRRLLRLVQPYTVSLRRSELDRARRRGWLRDGPVPVWTAPYDPVRGVGALLEQEEVVTW